MVANQAPTTCAAAASRTDWAIVAPLSARIGSDSSTPSSTESPIVFQ